MDYSICFFFCFRLEQESTNAQCQKRLEKGHWKYESKRKRKYVERPSRTQILEKRIKKLQKDRDDEGKNANETKKKYLVILFLFYFIYLRYFTFLF